MNSISVATAIAGVFANFTNKIGKVSKNTSYSCGNTKFNGEIVGSW